jgi:hypothetical protein
MFAKLAKLAKPQATRALAEGISVWPAASHTRTPVAIGIIAAARHSSTQQPQRPVSRGRPLR